MEQFFLYKAAKKNTIDFKNSNYFRKINSTKQILKFFMTEFSRTIYDFHKRTTNSLVVGWIKNGCYKTAFSRRLFFQEVAQNHTSMYHHNTQTDQEFYDHQVVQLEHPMTR